MARDKSYGSGYKNTGMSKATVSKQKLAKAPKSVTPAKRKTATALLTKKRADLAIDRSPNKNTKAAPMIGELSKMLTGVGTDSKGKFSIDPMGLAMALPVGKVVKAAAALRAAGKASQAAALSARVLAKEGGRNLPKTINEAKRMFTGIPESYTPKTASKLLQGGLSRDASTSVFPRKTPDVPFKKVGRNTYSQTTAGPARIEYLALKKDYQKVFGKNAKVGSFNPDLASMTSYPGRGTAASTLKRLSSRVDKYLANKKVK